MKIIDLSLPIAPHWRWPLEYSLLEENPRITGIRTGAHSFTHMDTPLHVEPGRITIEKVPLEATIGQALVMDLTYKKRDEEIVLSDVLPYEDKIQEGDIILMKTCWDTKSDYTTRDYWLHPPYVSREVSNWLDKKPIKAVGFDFPQEYLTRFPPPLKMEDQPTHDVILRNGKYLIEYLCNFSEIKKERVFFMALPLKYVGAEGSPVRAIAIEDLDEASLKLLSSNP